MSSEGSIKNDNDLSACNRLKQLRNLQNQLAMMITDARPEPLDGSDVPGLDDSARSTMSLTSGVSESNPSVDASARSALTLPADIESGNRFGPKDSAVKTSMETLMSMEDVQPLVESGNYVQGQESNPSIHHSNDSNIFSKDESELTKKKTGESTASVDPSLQQDRGRRSRSSSFSRPFARRRSRSRGSASSRGSKSGPLIFRRSKEKEPFLDEKPIAGHLPTYDFLSKQDDEKEERSLFPGAKWWHGVFIFSLVSALACITTLWAPYPIGARMPTEMVAAQPFSNGCQDGLKTCICPRETICADDLISMIFLTISRTSAWFDYPLYMLLFLSKANNLNNYMQKTVLRCWVNFSDYHKVHSLFGVVVAIESTSHSFFHILRWARRYDDIQFLWRHPTGITGLIALVLCPFIVLPMVLPFLKKRMTFEWRKGLHYLCILWGAALMKHAPQRIFWLIGMPIFVYATDKLVEVFYKTHLIESAHFQRLGDTSCIISFENPPGFGKQNSAYVYLMLPWLSKYQFHAFTVFPCCKPNHSSICISKCGNWTESLMKQIVTPTHKPAFVVGPFLSPFSSPAMDSENLVAVASGIGVTPAISLIKQYASTSRRLNLVWICRDAGLVEHFVTNVEFSGYGHILIYYTGGKKRSIVLGNDLPPNVFIFNGRPNLERTISGIIHSISSGDGLPEEFHKTHRVVSKAPAELRSKLLIEKALDIYTINQLFDFTVDASFQSHEDLDPLMPVVNYPGVFSTMKHLLGDDCELVTEKITTNFEKINVDSSCQLNRDEFERFIMMMLEEDDAGEMSSIASVKLGLKKMSTCKKLFDSQKKYDGFVSNKDEFGIRNILQGEGKYAAKNWNLLYCGGSEAVLAQLKAYKRKYSIGLSVEKFDW